MNTRSTLLPLAIALLPALAVAAPPAERGLQVVVACEACGPAARPSLGLLWRADAGAEPPLGSVDTVDWSAGSFTWTAPGRAAVALSGERLSDGSGWSLRIPVAPSEEQPFRIVAALPGFAPDRAAWWPESERGPFTFVMRPTAEILDARPQWDPERTGECEILVPRSAETPVTLFVQGQPRAWLYPAPAAADGTAQWTFQFVRPGEGLLERVSVLVPAFAEGDAWAFRLPLQAVLGPGATWPSAGQAPAPAPEPADEIRIGGVGTIRLQDCPRATR